MRVQLKTLLILTLDWGLHLAREADCAAGFTHLKRQLQAGVVSLLAMQLTPLKLSAAQTLQEAILQPSHQGESMTEIYMPGFLF